MSLEAMESLLNSNPFFSVEHFKNGWFIGFKRFGIRRRTYRRVIVSTQAHPVVNEDQSLRAAIGYISKLEDLGRMDTLKLESYIHSQRTGCIACGGKGTHSTLGVKREAQSILDRTQCPVCKGAGSIPGVTVERECACKVLDPGKYDLEICPTCDGRGIYMEDWCLTCQGRGAVCSNCHGTGKLVEQVPDKICTECKGSGFLESEREVVFETPVTTTVDCDVCKGKGFFYTEVIEVSVLERFPERQTDIYVDFDGVDLLGLIDEGEAYRIFKTDKVVKFRFEDRLPGPIFKSTQNERLIRLNQKLLELMPKYGQIYERVDCYLVPYCLVRNPQSNELTLVL